MPISQDNMAIRRLLAGNYSLTRISRLFQSIVLRGARRHPPIIITKSIQNDKTVRVLYDRHALMITNTAISPLLTQHLSTHLSAKSFAPIKIQNEKFFCSRGGSNFKKMTQAYFLFRLFQNTLVTGFYEKIVCFRFSTHGILIL